MAPAPKTALALIQGVSLEANLTTGVHAEAGASVTVRDSFAVGGGTAFLADANGRIPVVMNLEASVASNNVNAGVWAASFLNVGGAEVKIEGCVPTGSSSAATSAGILAQRAAAAPRPSGCPTRS